MNKAELVKFLANKFDLTQIKTDEILSALLETITKSLAKGDDVAFIGFGMFRVKKMNARTGRNSQNGALSIAF